jgi:hypothetical protein
LFGRRLRLGRLLEKRLAKNHELGLGVELWIIQNVATWFDTKISIAMRATTH